MDKTTTEMTRYIYVQSIGKTAVNINTRNWRIRRSFMGFNKRQNEFRHGKCPVMASDVLETITMFFDVALNTFLNYL